MATPGRIKSTVRGMTGTSPGDLATLDATGKFPASIVPSSGGGLSAPINLLKNTDVYDRTGISAALATVLPNHWEPVGGAVESQFFVYRGPNYVLVPIADAGPDATFGAIYFDAADSTRRFLVTITKVSGDTSTFLTVFQISGATKATATTGTLTKESGTGDASISWTSAPLYNGYSSDVGLASGEFANSTVTKATLTVIGHGFKQRLPFEQEQNLFPGAVASFSIPVSVASAGAVMKVDLLDQGGTSLGSSALSTSAAESGVEILTVENVTIPAGTTALAFQLTSTVAGVAYYFPPTLNVGATVIPYRPRGLGPWITQPDFPLVINLPATGDRAAALKDLSAYLPENAVEVALSLAATEPSPTATSTCAFYSHGTTKKVAEFGVAINTTEFNRGQIVVRLDDALRFGFDVNEGDANNNVSLYGNLAAYRCWED